MFDVIHLRTGYDAEYVAKNVHDLDQAEQIAEEFRIKMRPRVWHGQPCVIIRPVPPCRSDDPPEEGRSIEWPVQTPAQR